MSRLTELLRQAHRADPQLGADLEAEVSTLLKRRTFGLVFERHQPEAVELPQRAPRRGDKVRVLPPRGDLKTGEQRLWRIGRIEYLEGKKVAHLIELGAEEPQTLIHPFEDLVAVAEFNDPLYPGLIETGRVERGGDKPYHSVINAENFHALQTLTYTHRGKIDAIYIDPPYNTGAKDWKYNNDYVGDDDAYRHSKWLAMMEGRLKTAHELLNHEESVLIVTIDEKEYLRLGLLLEQLFPEAKIQMITTVTNQRGVARGQEFARVDEYAFVCFFGNALVTQVSDDLLTPEEVTKKQRIDIWNRLMRRGTDSQREDSANQFYPIFIDPIQKRIMKIGDPLPLGTARSTVEVPDGLVSVWPLRTDESEGRWTVSAKTLRTYVENGWVKVGQYNRRRDQWSISYLIRKDIQRIKDGELTVEGKDENGVLQIALTPEADRRRLPRTVWYRDSHNAGTYGSALLKNFLPGRKFPFPKSLYLVEDMLSVFIRDKPNATVLDFFSGSGTTAHAVMRLNKQDGGQRQSISVTNNEVSAEEQKKLLKQGLRPGDEQWEALGICEHITKPRIKAAITGSTANGDPIKGDYKFTDEFPMSDGFDENAIFFDLTFEGPYSIQHDRVFDRIAPMLWLRAGSEGRMVTELGEQGWDVSETYGVLRNLDHATEFTAQISDTDGVRLVFIVTDDESAFQMVCRDLPDHVEKVRLYESYLQNFMINTGRSL